MLDTFEVEQQSLLCEGMKKVVTAYFAASSAISDLNKLTSLPVYIPRIDDLLTEVFDNWYQGHLRSFSAAGAGITFAQIADSDVPNELSVLFYNSTQRANLRHRLTNAADLSEAHSLCEELCSEIDYVALFSCLGDLSSKIEGREITRTANMVASDLYLLERCRRDYAVMAPKRTGANLSFFTRIYISYDTYSCSTIEKLRALAQHFEVVEADTGIDGLHDAMKVITERFGYRHTLASRAKLNEGGIIEGIVFKDKLQLRMKADVAEAIIAFCKLHSSEELSQTLSTAA